MPSPPPEEEFRILSLDGGGIRGAFAAAFLAEVEAKLGVRIAEQFDLIAGTSTGGIIALAMGFEEPAEKVLEFYLKHGPRIFARSRSDRVVRWVKGKVPGFSQLKDVGVRRPAYAPSALRTALEEFFGPKRLEEAERRLLLPSVDLCKGQTVVFKTPHLADLQRDGAYGATDVALALCAAPTFFPPHSIATGSSYCDGGLWANNPAMVGYVEALKWREQRAARTGAPSRGGVGLRLLSVGTGAARSFVKAPPNGGGIAFWARSLVELTALSQSQGVHFQCRYLLPESQYQRIDFELPDKSWALDSVERLEALVHLGRERAVESIGRLREMFASGPRPRRGRQEHLPLKIS